VQHVVEAVYCHDAHAISGTQIMLLWKGEVLPFTCDTQTFWSSYKFWIPRQASATGRVAGGT